MVIWITGLSGAGKSSIAREVVRLLKEKGHPVILLDGDAVRSVVDDPHVRYDRQSRLVNAKRISRLAKLVADQDIVVVVATISLYEQIHNWNRQHLANYFEVYVKADLNVLIKRDARGLYSKAAAGVVENVVGFDLLEYDEPKAPDLVLKNNEPVDSFEDLAAKVLECFFEIKGVP